MGSEMCIRDSYYIHSLDWYNKVKLEGKNAMLDNYLPVFIFLAVATAIGLVLLGLGFLFGGGDKDKEKLSPYECGFEPFEESRMKFDVRYYLVAILFIIFDLEIAFLFPWAVSLDVIGTFGLVAMAIFLAILVVFFNLFFPLPIQLQDNIDIFIKLFFYPFPWCSIKITKNFCRFQKLFFLRHFLEFFFCFKKIGFPISFIFSF